MDYSEQQLIASYLKGDEKSLEILIGKYLKPIYSFVYKRVGNISDAEDITQDTFIKTWRNLKKPALHRIYSGAGFNPRKGTFKTWIFTIAKNTCIDFHKKKKALPLSKILIDPSSLPDKIFERINLTQLLRSVTEKLLPKYQLVLSLYYNDQLNFREIAQTLKEPLNTIKSRHRRALIMLKNLLES